MKRAPLDGVWSVKGTEIALDRPVVLGILNLTPDSFSDGGTVRGAAAALEAGRVMVEQGADLIDVGGESTRPGAPPVGEEEEWARIGPAVAALARDGVLVSVDTTKADVARRAIDAGAVAVNDVSGLGSGPGIAELSADTGCGLVLMHMRGTPRTMQDDVVYRDLVGEISTFLESRAERAMRCGVQRSQIVLDPGIGFGKSVAGNLEILARSGEFAGSGFPVLVGPSRKSFIGAVLDLPVDQRLEGTIAACVTALVSGARLFRVHDVRPVRRALDLAWEIIGAHRDREAVDLGALPA